MGDGRLLRPGSGCRRLAGGIRLVDGLVQLLLAATLFVGAATVMAKLIPVSVMLCQVSSLPVCTAAIVVVERRNRP
ncbi:hypothetical protein ACFY0B_14805 [Streptomyces sp. NPDC001797]|uniref:hypothetical protein n=1 Tax=Streptomyces sp. NPDC001797 TaxID=3364610 RepID=UPI00368C4CD4